MELLAVIGVAAVLAAILFPVLANAKGTATKASCLSNVRSAATAMLLYSEAEDGHFPPAFEGDTRRSQGLKTWVALIRPYEGGDLRCPAQPRTPEVPLELDSGYCINDHLGDSAFDERRRVWVYAGKTEEAVANPSAVVMLNECSVSFISCDSYEGDFYFLASAASEFKGYAGQGDSAGTRHGAGSNYDFVDGHARFLRPNDFKRKGPDSPRFTLEEPTQS